MKYVFDLDGTLCSQTGGDYVNAKPYLERIHKVNDLYDQGNSIVIYTARGMGSSDNQIEYAREWWESLTIEQLRVWGVKYHSLFLGKPSADLYVDDKAITDLDFFGSFKS